jgi:hypothetical protein
MQKCGFLRGVLVIKRVGTAHRRRGKYGFRRVVIDNRSHVARPTMEETLNAQ